MYIMNSDDHWVSIYRHKNENFFYDSFGRNIHTLSPYWKHLKVVQEINNKKLERQESYNESNCGQLSLNFLILFDKYKEQILKVI